MVHQNLNALRILAMVTLAVVRIQDAYAAPLDLHWPQERHDAGHTNFSPGKGHLDQPAVKWRLPLGGAVSNARFVDVDLDGADDLVSIEGGRVTARTAAGKILWSSPQLAAVWIAALGDVHGDGTLAIAVGSSNRAHLVSASDGALLWSSDLQNPPLGNLALGDFDGDGILDVAVGAYSAAGIDVPPETQLIAFAPTQRLIATNAAVPTLEQMPSIAGENFVDVDGDNVVDIVLPGMTHFYAFSGKSGQLLGHSPNFATIGALGAQWGSFRPDPSKPPILLFAADTPVASYLWHGIVAMQLQGGALQVLWSQLWPEVATQAYVTVPGSIADLDGDGQGEVMAAVFDKGAWQLEARDALTGAVLHTLSAAQVPGQGTGGPYLRGIVHTVAGARPTLVVQRALNQSVPALGPLTLWQWSRKDGFIQYADVGMGSIATQNWSVHSSAGSGVVATVNGDPIAWLDPWGDPTAAQASLLVDRDVDGDQGVDALEQLRIAKDGTVKSAGVLPLAPGASVLGVARAGAGKPNTLVRGLRDGTAAFLDQAGVVQNDANADGSADLRYGGVISAYFSVAPVQDADKAGRILLSTYGDVRLLDTSAAGPTQAPTTALTPPLQLTFGRGNLADVNGDGKRDIVVRGLTKSNAVTLSAFAVDGSPLWSYEHPNGPWQWSGAEGDGFAIADVNGDGGEDLICQWEPAGTQTQLEPMTVISGKTGQDLWPADAPCRISFAAFSVDVLGATKRIIASVYRDRFACDAQTGGITVHTLNNAPSYGVSLLQDLDGDGVQDQVLVGASDGMAAETTTDFKSFWHVLTPGAYHASGALVLTPAGALAAQASLSQPTIQVVSALSGLATWASGYVDGHQVAVADAAKTGFATVGMLAAADLTGAGHPSLLFRTTEGYLYCVNAQNGAVDWALNWGGTFGDPVVADIDGDGELEVLVTHSDGALYALDHSTLAPVAWVRENDGSGPALDDAADIDTQEDTQTLHTNWAATPNAQGYAVSLLDQNAVTVAPEQLVNGKTDATLTGLTMHLGQHYQVAVRAYIASGADQAFSPTTLSDGVTIVDVSPPWIDGQQLTPVAVMAGQTVQLAADLHDKTRLHSWRISVALAGNVAPVWHASALVAQPLVHVAQSFPTASTGGAPWEPGDYTVHLEATDGAQHTAAVDLPLHVCAGAPVSATACSPSNLTADASSSGGDVDSTMPSENAGCGCRVGSSPRTVPTGALLFLGFCLALLWRARRFS